MSEGQRPPAREGGSSRRDFLKKSAVAGGVLWAAPAVTSASRAFAQAGSPIGPFCNEAGCFGTGFGLSQNVFNPGVFPPTAGSPCPGNCFVDVNINSSGPTMAFPISARSGTFCGCHTFTDLPGDAGNCRSEGSIEDLDLRVWKGLFTNPVTGMPAASDLIVQGELLKSFTQQGCPHCGVTRGADTVEVRITDPRTGVFFGVGQANAPNTVIVDSTVTFPGFRIVANEQGCSDATHPSGSGLWYTAALHIRLPAAVSPPFGRHIFLGYSAARQDACGPCVPPGGGGGAPLIPIP